MCTQPSGFSLLPFAATLHLTRPVRICRRKQLNTFALGLSSHSPSMLQYAIWNPFSDEDNGFEVRGDLMIELITPKTLEPSRGCSSCEVFISTISHNIIDTTQKLYMIHTWCCFNPFLQWRLHSEAPKVIIFTLPPWPFTHVLPPGNSLQII